MNEPIERGLQGQGGGDDLELRVEVAALRTRVAALEQQRREAPARSESGDDGGGSLAALEAMREQTDLLRSIDGRLGSLEALIQSQ